MLDESDELQQDQVLDKFGQSLLRLVARLSMVALIDHYTFDLIGAGLLGYPHAGDWIDDKREKSPAYFQDVDLLEERAALLDRPHNSQAEDWIDDKWEKSPGYVKDVELRVPIQPRAKDDYSEHWADIVVLELLDWREILAPPGN